VEFAKVRNRLSQRSQVSQVTRCVVNLLGSHAGGGWFAAGTALQDIIRASYHIKRDWASARGYMSFFLALLFSFRYRFLTGG
jgi:hypothetical protein